MRNPRDFVKPLAVGAPDPLLEIPFTPSRMIHFFDPRTRRWSPSCPTSRPGDILLGNLEDAVPVDRKEAAREGCQGRQGDRPRRDAAVDAGQLARVALGPGRHHEARHRDRRPARRDHGPQGRGAWDIHYVDRLLASSRRRPGSSGRSSSTRSSRRLGVQPRGDRGRLPAHAGHELRPGRPRRLAPHEDDARRRRPPRLPRDRDPDPANPDAPRHRAAGPWHYSIARMVDACTAAGSCPSTARSATSRTSPAARPSSAPRSCWAASAPGRCTRCRSTSPRRSSRPTRTRSSSPSKVIEAIPDGRGVHMIDGKMQDDATWKQCRVMVDLAEMLAPKDPELAEAYGMVAPRESCSSTRRAGCWSWPASRAGGGLARTPDEAARSPARSAARSCSSRRC